MKSIKLTNTRVTAKYIDKVKAAQELVRKYIDSSERTKNAYFWSFGGNCDHRASKLRYLDYDVSGLIEFNSDVYDFSLDVSASRKNVFVSKYFYINGDGKDVRAAKKLDVELTAIVNSWKAKHENEIKG